MAPKPPLKHQMKGKRPKIILLCLASLLATFFTFYLTQPKEPSYEGKTLIKWLYQYISVPHIAGNTAISPLKADAEHAIKTIGTNGIPTLLKLVCARDVPGAKSLESFVQKLSWKTFYLTHARIDHMRAREGFTILGRDAQSAAPELLQLLRTCSSDSVLDVPFCLICIKPPKSTTLPTLTEMLNISDTRLNYQVAVCLLTLYPEEAEKAGVYELYPQLKSSTPNIYSLIPPKAKKEPPAPRSKSQRDILL